MNLYRPLTRYLLDLVEFASADSGKVFAWVSLYLGLSRLFLGRPHHGLRSSCDGPRGRGGV